MLNLLVSFCLLLIGLFSCMYVHVCVCVAFNELHFFSLAKPSNIFFLLLLTITLNDTNKNSHKKKVNEKRRSRKKCGTTIDITTIIFVA